jgi:1,2-diacylglycerol 3-beta-glucosyltransferase
MASRLTSIGVLLASALIAWLAVSFETAARLLQAAIGLSIVYVAYLAWRGWQVMRAAHAAAEGGTLSAEGEGDRPWITVVVPARNEASVIARVVTDLAAQSYADASGPRYDILVVDDGSDDRTGELADAAGPGGRVRVARRESTGGQHTKGAVLAFAEPLVQGSILGVVDADARLAPTFLEDVQRAWERDPAAGAIQAQRRERNAAAGWLPAAQDAEQLMDMASQCGRRATDGTAELRGNGMFLRREALDRVGGWHPEALTEDLELSTRLVAAGERIGLAPEAIVSEEAVESLRALWAQRLRWAEGSLRRLMERGPALLTARAVPFARKLDFLAFCGEFVIAPLFVAAILASVATALLTRTPDWTVPASLFVVYGAGSFLLATAGLAGAGVRGWALPGQAARGALFLSHWLVVVPAALLRIGFGPSASAFVQTSRIGDRPVPRSQDRA